MVFLEVILGSECGHPEIYELSVLIEASMVVNTRLGAQAWHQPTILTALVRLIKTEFNEIFRQVFTSALPVRWNQIANLVLILAIGNFIPYYVVMPGVFKDIIGP